jgi:hypothetical protein
MNISIPVKIITKKIAQNKQDSFFYAGKNIAEVKIRNRTYVLTTAGMYQFSFITGLKNFLKDKGLLHGKGNWGRKEFKLESDSKLFPLIAKKYRLTDYRINQLTDDSHMVSNWGWFGINVWEQRPEIPGLPAGKDFCLDYPTDAYSTYDEAMEAFIAFVEEDISGKRRSMTESLELAMKS